MRLTADGTEPVTDSPFKHRTTRKHPGRRERRFSQRERILWELTGYVVALGIGMLVGAFCCLWFRWTLFP
jgi:hypothetical protein